MTRDDIIRLARECKLHLGGPPVTPELDRFYRAAYEAGAAAEREACARDVEQYGGAWDATTSNFARLIRARSKE